MFPVASGEHQFKFSAKEPAILLKGFQIHGGRELCSVTLANPAWRVYGGLDSLNATCGIGLQDSVEACMDETLSRGFSGFIYNGSSCCIKAAGTLDLLRNMVEEEDNVFYIYPAVGSLRRDAHADHYEIGSSLGQ